VAIVASVANIVAEGVLMKEEPTMVTHDSKFSVSIAKTLVIDLCDSFDKDDLSPPNVVVPMSMISRINEELALRMEVPLVYS
jgi:hypothetical protein